MEECLICGAPLELSLIHISSLEDLLVRLQREGYEIKRGKYISTRVPD